MSTPLGPFALSTVVQSSNAMKYMLVACLTLLGYEWMVGLKQEYVHIWSRPWTAGKVLFLLNRYLPPISLAVDTYALLAPAPAANFCSGWFVFKVVMTIMNYAASESILITSTSALCHGSKRVLLWLSCLFTVVIITHAVILGVGVSVVQPLSSAELKLAGLTGCVAVVPVWFWSAFLPLLVFDGVVLSITTVKAFEHRRLEDGMSLLSVVIRDGVLFYSFAFAISIGNLIVFLTALIPLRLLFLPLLQAGTAIVAARLLLDVRKASSQMGRRDRQSAYEMSTLAERNR